MTESFVNTLKRDYVSQIDRSTALMVLAQLSDPFEYFDEVNPHSAPKLKSPRMFNMKLVRQVEEK